MTSRRTYKFQPDSSEQQMESSWSSYESDEEDYERNWEEEIVQASTVPQTGELRFLYKYNIGS